MNVKLTHSATVRVTLQVEIALDTVWGGDCSIAQVHTDAIAEAETRVRQIFTKGDVTNVRVCAPAQVTAVVVKGKP